MRQEKTSSPTSQFCAMVYAETKRIPKGMVSTYGDIALSIGKLGAARAVGSCLKRNFDPNVPCHRVIKSTGNIGAYNRGGPAAKRMLLEKEGWDKTFARQHRA